MSLDETIAYVEAKEMSVKATHTLEKGALTSRSMKWVLKEGDNDWEKFKY